MSGKYLDNSILYLSLLIRMSKTQFHNFRPAVPSQTFWAKKKKKICNLLMYRLFQIQINFFDFFSIYLKEKSYLSLKRYFSSEIYFEIPALSQELKTIEMAYGSCMVLCLTSFAAFYFSFFICYSLIHFTVLDFAFSWPLLLITNIVNFSRAHLILKPLSLEE